MNTPEKHRARIAAQDANMPAPLRDVMSTPAISGNLHEPMSAPQPTPVSDELTLADELAANVTRRTQERDALAAECERLLAERDALRAALAGLIALSNDIEAELEHTGAINDSSLSPASETEPYRIAVAVLNQ